MIWNITFKNEKAKKKFEKLMIDKNLCFREFHDHYHGEVSERYGDFYYDMDYLGYAEVEELKPKLKKLGVIELNQICLCDIEGNKVITPKP